MNSLRRQAEIRLCRIAVLLVLCALLAGCRNNPRVNNHLDVLNAEKLALESQIYELEYDYERAVAELKDAKDEIERLRDGSGRRRAARSGADESEEPFDATPPTVTPGDPSNLQIEGVGPPGGEGGSLPAPGSSTLPPPGSSGLRAPRRRLLDRQGTEPISVPSRLQPGDPRITHIQINASRTGGTDFDDEPGDDGITLAIEPRNEANEFVPLSGPLSIVVLDYGRRNEGEASRLGRWELDAQQVETSMANNDFQRGIEVRLAWSNKKPAGSKLLVAVRYTTLDGRELEAKRDIFVKLPGQFSQRWTPRSSNRTARRAEESDDARPTANEGAAIERPQPATDTAAASFESEQPVWRPYR